MSLMARSNTMRRRKKMMLKPLDSFMIRSKKKEGKVQPTKESLENSNNWSMIRLALLMSTREDRPHWIVKSEPFNNNLRKKETKAWLMRPLFANLKTCWERRSKSWTKRLVTLKLLQKTFKKLIWSSTSSGTKSKMKGERAQSTKTS